VTVLAAVTLESVPVSQTGVRELSHLVYQFLPQILSNYHK